MKSSKKVLLIELLQEAIEQMSKDPFWLPDDVRIMSKALNRVMVLK